MKNPFITFMNYFGKLAEAEDGTILYGVENCSTENKDKRIYEIESEGGCYGYVQSGAADIKPAGKDFCNLSYWLDKNYWFSTPNKITITLIHPDTRVVVFQKKDYKGALAFGLVEPEGRLNYINGCKDTLLSSPIKKGLPCLNALYMPEGVHQSSHTHPSTRAGMIIVGGANCETPEQVYPLLSGMIFLPKDSWHKFRSDHGQDITMKLVAFHPDSDFGPSDENHPMLNRTMVGDVSAKDMPEIRTQG